MYFSSWQEAFVMSGHGAYVWASFAIGFVVLLSLALYPIFKKRKQLSALKRQYLFDGEKN